MRKNEMYRSEGTTYRILDIQQEDALVIDCKRMTMPQWVKIEEIPESGVFPENELFPELGISPISEECLTAEQSKVAHERFTIIADILPHIGNKPTRNRLVAQAAESNGISRRTVTNYLCQYLVHQSIAVLAPQVKNTERELTQDEKNIRWALNARYFKNTARAIEDMKHGTKDVTAAFADYNAEADKAVKANEEYQAASKKMAAGTEVTAEE